MKPNTKQEVINGIYNFLVTVVTVECCNKKKDHLFRVVDEVLRLNGKPTDL